MTAKPSVLRFVLTTREHPMRVMERFRKEGRAFLNRTTWMGKEPRSCGVTVVRGHGHSLESGAETTFKLEVSYRPKGLITYVGNTRYDGWTMMLLDQNKEGQLLDGHGQLLQPGCEPVFLPYEVYPDVDYNELDFGVFVEEVETGGVPHVDAEVVMQRVYESGKFSDSLLTQFAVPRRTRPPVKVVLSNSSNGTASDGFGTRIYVINKETPYLRRVLEDTLTDILTGYLEGRYALHTISNDVITYASLSDVLVDDAEQDSDARFHCFQKYLPHPFLEEMAMRLASVFRVKVSVVDAPKGGGLLFERDDADS